MDFHLRGYQVDYQQTKGVGDVRLALFFEKVYAQLSLPSVLGNVTLGLFLVDFFLEVGDKERARHYLKSAQGDFDTPILSEVKPQIEGIIEALKGELEV